MWTSDMFLPRSARTSHASTTPDNFNDNEHSVLMRVHHLYNPCTVRKIANAAPYQTDFQLTTATSRQWLQVAPVSSYTR